MSIDFPTSPSDGEIYSSGGAAWIWNSSKNVWLIYQNIAISGFSGFSGTSGYSGTSSTVLTVANDTTTNPLYPVMVSGTGAGQSAKVTTASLYFDATTGDLTVGGDVNTLSDERLKYDITKITDALNKVLDLQGVSYKLKSTSEAHIGLIAQHTQGIVPEVVNNGDIYLSISYGNIVALLIEAIKELNEKIESLKAQGSQK